MKVKETMENECKAQSFVILKDSSRPLIQMKHVYIEDIYVWFRIYTSSIILVDLHGSEVVNYQCNTYRVYCHCDNIKDLLNKDGIYSFKELYDAIINNKLDHKYSITTFKIQSNKVYNPFIVYRMISYDKSRWYISDVIKALRAGQCKRVYLTKLSSADEICENVVKQAIHPIDFMLKLHLNYPEYSVIGLRHLENELLVELFSMKHLAEVYLIV